MTNLHAATLRAACRVIGLARYSDVVGSSRSYEAKATRTLFVALCRRHYHHGAPATYIEIAVAMGRTRDSQSFVSKMISGEPGPAMAKLARAWHELLDGGPLTKSLALTVAALKEVAPQLAEALDADCGKRDKAIAKEAVEKANSGQLMSNDEVGSIVGLESSSVWRIAERAMEKLRASGGDKELEQMYRELLESKIGGVEPSDDAV